MITEQAIKGLSEWYVERGDERKVAQAITRSATRREVAAIPQRWRNLVYYREMTGRPTPATYLYSMAKRPSGFLSHYGSYGFSGIRAGFAGMMCDVYVNRVLGHKTFISWLPDGGDWDDRRQATDYEAWVESGFDQLGYWRERATAIKEAIWYGTGWIKFASDGRKDAVIKAVNLDELLWANPDDTDPDDVIQRCWMKRTELLARPGITPEQKKAIMTAPSAEPAFYFGSRALDCSNVIPLLEGYLRPVGDEKGRHVLVIGDCVLLDEKWDAPLPYEAWRFDEIPGSVNGQGIGELLLQISQWIDGLLSSGQESELRNGKPKWMVEENSGVNGDALGDLDAAIVNFLGTEPKLVTPEPIGAYFLNHLNWLLQYGRSRVHVSDAAVKGDVPAGVTAAVAMEKYAQIDDQNFLEKIGRLEDLDRRAAYQLLLIGKRLKCKFYRVGSKRERINWDDLKLNANFRLDNLAAYNVGRIAQTVAGRMQILKEMYAEQTIPKELYVKYSQIPDTTGMFRELNADVDDVQNALDKLVKNDAYRPPSPFLELVGAKNAVERRLCREEADGAPQAVLDRMMMWRSAVMAMLKESATPEAPAGGGPGMGVPSLGGPPNPEPGAIAPSVQNAGGMMAAA